MNHRINSTIDMAKLKASCRGIRGPAKSYTFATFKIHPIPMLGREGSGRSISAKSMEKGTLKKYKRKNLTDEQAITQI